MKTKTPKKAYTPEYKEQAVLHAQGVGIGSAARELGISAQTLRSWVKARDARQALERRAAHFGFSLQPVEAGVS